MNKEECKKIIMPQIGTYGINRYIIYGTGEVAQLYCDEIKKLFGEEAIKCFIDGTSHIRKSMENKPVMHFSELTSISVNEYKYILATISRSAVDMKNRLLEAGVNEENIMPTIPFFNPLELKEGLKGIHKIYIYPEFETEQEFIRFLSAMKMHMDINNIKVELHFFIREQSQGNLFGTDNRNIFVHKTNFICGNEEQSVILVSEAERLLEIAEKFDRVYCVDDKFLLGIFSRMFRTIYEMKGMEKNAAYYVQSSIINFQKLRAKADKSKGIGIFGAGPSLRQGVEKYSFFLKDTCNIVCNDIYKLDEVMQKINPMLYVLSDVVYIKGDFEKEVKEIIAYVETHDCWLGVFSDWIPTMIAHYNISESKIIGFQIVRDEVIFPTEENMKVCTLGNVVLTFSFSIGFSLGNQIYVMGCDGSADLRKGEWSYADGITVENKWWDAIGGRAIGTRTQVDIREQLSTMKKGYEIILGNAKKQGKQYYTLTHSNFELLEENYIEIS